MLGSDKNIQILEHEAYPDEQAAQQQQAQLQQAMQAAQMGDQQATQAVQQLQSQPPVMLHNIKISVTETKGKICIKNVAPENMMISVDTPNTCLQDSRFVQHREYSTKAELEEQGFEVPEGIENYDQQFEVESIARNRYDEQYTLNYDGRILVKDTYMRVDGKLMRYVVAGNTILHREEAEIVPICCITPHLMPHRHIGRSYADLTMSDQLVGSTLMRGMVNALYLANNPRHAISDKVNLEDMMVSRYGGLVRTGSQPAGEIMQLISPNPSAMTFSLIELLNSNREKRTGVVSYNQGLDADSLNKTKGGMQMIMNAAQERLLNVARLFAETGVKDLFVMVHRLVRTNYTKPDIVRLRNKWVEVDPRSWKTRTDMSITVGLGTGNKDQQLQHLMTMLQVQQQALQIGISTPKNIYHACIKLAQNAGFKDAEEFFTDPSNQQQQPQQPDPKVVEAQMEMQLEGKKLEQKAQNDQAVLQQAQQTQQQDFYIKTQELLQNAQETQSKQYTELTKMVNEVALETKRMGMDFIKHQSTERNKIDSMSKDTMHE